MHIAFMVFHFQLDRNPLIYLQYQHGIMISQVYPVSQWMTVVPDDAAPTQLITLNLLTKWCYTKMARQKIIFARCT